MKNAQLMSFCLIFLLNILSIGHSQASKISLRQADLTIPENVKILFQGWAKYFKSSTKINSPSEFFQNNQYFSQRYPINVSQTSDKYGSFVIPEASNFFVVLYRNLLSVYSARDEIFRHSIDNLEVDTIGPIPEDQLMKGAINKLGKFNAGFCFRVATKVPSGFQSTVMNSKYWIFCLENEAQQESLTNSLVKLKVMIQRSKGEIVSQASTQEKSDEEGPAKDESSPSNLNDGRLVLLQDWSDCTLKCGGGKAYQQWMCIPPKSGGKPCAGDLIREKECNVQPCPEIITGGKDDSNSSVFGAKLDKPPIVKVARFSKRYNRYSKCIIKETDIFSFDESGNKRPSRFLMNNKTISIFGDDDYMNKEASYDIETTELKLMKEPCCFELVDRLKKNKYCGFDASCGDPQLNVFSVNMQNVFAEFKSICNVGRQTLFITTEEEAKIKKTKQVTMQIRQNETEKEKLQQAKVEMAEDVNSNFAKKIEVTQNNGMKALEKELMIENLIRKDEENKETLKEKEIVQQIAVEKKKKDEVIQQIQEKELEDELIIEQIESEKEVNLAKTEISKQIAVNRKNLKAKILTIKKEAQNRRDQLKSKLKKIKSELSLKLIKANKNGDKAICLKGTKDVNTREKYCNDNYVEDYIENQYCKDEESFCFSCCDSEFGTFKPVERDNCYEACDKK